MIKLTLEQADLLLDVLYSNSDPVIHKGKETTVNEMSIHYPDQQANHTRVVFWSSHGKGIKKIRGTVGTMIKERLGVNHGR